MCGRVIQASPPLRLALFKGIDVVDPRAGGAAPRFNGAPGQELLVIRENHETGRCSLDLLKWGLIPSWCRDEKGGLRPINAKAETVAKLPTFRDAYRKRRAILPIDGFFEWRAVGGGKQPYAITRRDGAPFGLAGLWENWKDPRTDQWVRTFAVITVPANELVRFVHDRMPAILPSEGYARWLGSEPDPGDLLAPSPADAMRLWPISTRVNSVKNDDAALLDEVAA